MSDNYVEEICKTSRMTIEEITTRHKSTLKLLNIIGEQAEEIERLKKGHIANVMSSRLRREIQNFVLNKWDTEKDCNQAVKFADALISGISCEEISET